MPKPLQELGAKAIEKHQQRQATPELKITTEEGQWWFGSPYAPEDEDTWVALLFEAFGTRSQGTFRTFMSQLSELCSTDWNEAEEAWHPAQDELNAAVQIVRSTRPRNEAEACLAAQMVAVHVMQMKLSAQAIKGGWPDPRSCAIAGKLARTYAMQLETMAKLRGKGSRQRITVRKYSQHEHKHIHLHQGGVENGNQPHGPRAARTTEIKEALEPPTCRSLPSQNPSQHGMSVPGCEGKEPLSSPRRRGGLGRPHR